MTERSEGIGRQSGAERAASTLRELCGERSQPPGGFEAQSRNLAGFSRAPAAMTGSG
ncbi:MAG TPA: hypothetical protein VKY85_16720 [Candidatus Angelobacter sp.]|nr:hypothetical protein [Candidatus Angelobacter sp.]